MIAAVTLGVLAVVTAGTAFAAYQYDASTSDRILPGVSVGGVDVSGMRRDEAVRTLRELAEQTLYSELVVQAAGHSWNVTPASLGMTANVEGAVAIDKFALASKRGGRVGLAESLDELDYLPDEWGYDGPTIRAQIEDYNRTAEAGEVLHPGRTRDAAPLDEGPWYVVECVPALTFPFHGIRIDDHARVLGQDGSAVPGLLCAGSDTGGVYNRAYAGGLASALVFGLSAAATASAEIAV